MDESAGKSGGARGASGGWSVRVMHTKARGGGSE